MAKRILYDAEATLKLISGVDKLGNAVKSTLGPRGKNVILDQGDATPIVTNDGVTIAEDIVLSDNIEQMGARIVRDVARKTNDLAGDGTTTATLLTQAIAKEGLRNIMAGSNSLAIRRGLDKACKKVVDLLKSMSKPISTKEDYKNVATISAENDELGEIIAQTIEEAGINAPIKVESYSKIGYEKEIVKGLQFNKGFISPYMITDRVKGEAVIDGPAIIITEDKLSFASQILPLIQKLLESKRKEFVIVAEDVEGEALAMLIINNVQGVFRAIAVKAPGFGPRKKEMLEDLAIVSGGKVISKEKGVDITTVGLDYIGSARKIISDKDNTTIIEGAGDESKINERISEIDRQIQEELSEHERDMLKMRRDRLYGGVAILRVGAATELETKANFHKAEDAVNATKSAIEEGIVPGGGSALLWASYQIGDVTDNLEEKIGVDILTRALRYPIKQIVDNAGFDGNVVIDKIVTTMSINGGYDAENHEYVQDMFSAGIVDPLKVVRCAVENAVSAASTLLTANCAVADEPIIEKDNKKD